MPQFAPATFNLSSVKTIIEVGQVGLSVVPDNLFLHYDNGSNSTEAVSYWVFGCTFWAFGCVYWAFGCVCVGPLGVRVGICTGMICVQYLFV